MRRRPWNHSESCTVRTRPATLRHLCALLLAVVTLGACTDPSPEPPSSPSTQAQGESGAETEAHVEAETTAEPDHQFSDEDIAHAQDLLALHRTSLELHEIIRSKAGIPQQVGTLALSLHTTHRAEIDELEDMLTAWDATVPEGQDFEVVTTEDFRELAPTSGAEAADLYLGYMITLHQARTSISETVILEGENQDLVDLAQNTLNVQQLEMTHMDHLLDDLGGSGEETDDDGEDDDG